MKTNTGFDMFLKIIISLLLTLAITWDSFNVTRMAIFPISFILIFLVLHLLWPKLLNWSFAKNRKPIKGWEYIVYGVFIIGALAFAVLAHYPARTSPDVISQYNQALTNTYTNWHPVLHTLFSFKLPQMFYKGIISSTIFQVTIIGSILLYFCHFRRKNFLNFGATLLVLLTIVLNPAFFSMSVVIWKDIPYSWAIFLLTLYLINISLSDGEWLKKNSHKVVFILASLPILFFRHNGIIPFVLVYLALLIFYPQHKKFTLISLISILVCSFIITGPVYKTFNIDNKTGGKSEMVGLVMGQVSYYYHNNLDFNEDEVALLEKVAPVAKWNGYYNQRNFNSFKFNISNYNANVEANFKPLMQLWFQKSLNYPSQFIVSYLDMTSPIWEVKSSLSGANRKFNAGENDVTNKVQKAEVTYTKFIESTPLRWGFMDIGEGLLAILLALAMVFKKAKFNFERWLPFVPVLMNTAVIMLLITGREYRFVYAQALCAMPLLLYAFSDKLNNHHNKRFEKMTKALFVNKTDNTFIQFFRYIFVGGLAAVVNIGMLYVFTEIFNIYYIISNILAFTLGLIVNYVLSKKFVFPDTSYDKKREFVIYAIIGVLGLLIDTLLIGLMTNILHIYYMLSKIISTIIVFIWNFGARKVFYKIIK